VLLFTSTSPPSRAAIADFGKNATSFAWRYYPRLIQLAFQFRVHCDACIEHARDWTPTFAPFAAFSQAATSAFGTLPFTARSI
jgi:hypothetical protein